jgi:hypothetical protein
MYFQAIRRSERVTCAVALTSRKVLAIAFDDGTDRMI